MIEEQSEYALRIGELLESEISAMSELYSCQIRMYESVLKRDWVSLQGETALKDSLAVTLERIESDRKIIMAQASKSPGSAPDFYRVTSSFPEDTRKRLNERYREFKRMVLLAKTENDIFDAYLEHAKALLTGLIETFVPARRNKIYSRNGSLMAGPVESLVLNRSF